jgi:hypothetical protein
VEAGRGLDSQLAARQEQVEHLTAGVPVLGQAADVKPGKFLAAGEVREVEFGQRAAHLLQMGDRPGLRHLRQRRYSFS